MVNFEQGFNESRNCFRTMINQQVSITLLDDETNSDVLANCRDISENGIALEIEHPVEVGTKIRIHLDCDDQISVPLTDCLGRVLRCEEESKDLFLLAIEIIDSK
ncbi:PilZ domain-containing protein [Thalassotalea crassostreae]|uniref:PilZ domain-containing protein n=1 Tax=Thalassotalea crassostreae TaxID=1763536 RepID=UPI000838679B|nr:PilZ domain-containing protein [Thalassotalea crassostreae]